MADSRCITIFVYILYAAGLFAGGCRRASEAPAEASPQELTIFAAASTTPALTELAALYKEQTGTTLRLNFASSGTLARQIEAGGPADIFISANPKWMDHLQSAAMINIRTRGNLLANRLVVIAPQGGRFDVEMAREFDFASVFDGRLAIGDPSHVPAGAYAVEALTSLGWLAGLEGRLAPCADVRAALRMVGHGETEAGIVYASDAASSQEVAVVAVFPESTHRPIRYPIAVTANAQSGSEALLRWLGGERASAVFKRHGFSSLGPTMTLPPSSVSGATAGGIAEALSLSARVAAWTVAVLLGPGVALGWLLARKEFRGKAIVSGLVHMPLVIPPIATGYLLLVTFGVNGVVGRWLDEAFGLRLAFTWRAAVLASSIVALPLMVRAVRLAMEQVDRRLEQAARLSGASRVGAFATVTLPLAAPGIIGGCLLAFARSLGEFGATITFAGNISGETRTLSLAAFSHMQTPDGDAAAMHLVAISVGVSLAAVAVSEYLTARVRRRLAVRA
jgi:molybdate transport system permease protein